MSTSPSSAMREVDAGQRAADGADAQRLVVVDRRGGRRLGEAVALVDGDADAAEEVAEPVTERGAAGDGAEAAAAEGGAQLAVDQLVEQRVLGLAARGPAPPVSWARDQSMATWAALSKILPLPSASALALAVLKTFSNTRGTARTNVGLNSPRSLDQVLHVRGVADDGAGLDRADLDDAGQHVRQRDEQQERAVDVEEPAEQAHAVADLEQEVAVRELAALGPAGGAAGVDQRGQAVGVERRAAGLELAVGHVLAGLGQLVDGVVVDDVDRPQVGRLVAHGLDGGGVLVALDDDGGGAGVGQDPGDLVGAGGLVDRDGDGAGGPDREVDDRPTRSGSWPAGRPGRRRRRRRRSAPWRRRRPGRRTPSRSRPATGRRAGRGTRSGRRTSATFSASRSGSASSGPTSVVAGTLNSRTPGPLLPAVRGHRRPRPRPGTSGQI